MNAVRRLRALLLVAVAGTVASAFAQAPLSASEAVALLDATPDVVDALEALDAAGRALEIAGVPVGLDLTAELSPRWDIEGSDLGVGGSVSARASLDALPFGSGADALANARDAYEAAAAALAEVRATTAVTLVRQFASAQRAGEEVAASEETAASAAALAAALAERRDAGGASDAEVLAARLEATAAAQDVAEAERTELDALAALSTTLGRDVVAVTGTLRDADANDPRLQDDAGIDARRDVIAARLAVDEAERAVASEARTGGTSAALSLAYGGTVSGLDVGVGASFDTRLQIPEFTATAGFESGVSTSDAGDLTLSLSASVPLDRTHDLTLESLEAGVAQAADDLDRVRELARLEIASLRRSLDAAGDALDLADQLASQAEDDLAYARARLDLGLVTPFDVDDAAEAATSARIALERARDTHREAVLNLAAALALEPLDLLQEVSP